MAGRETVGYNVSSVVEVPSEKYLASVILLDLDRSVTTAGLPGSVAPRLLLRSQVSESVYSYGER